MPQGITQLYIYNIIICQNIKLKTCRKLDFMTFYFDFLFFQQRRLKENIKVVK